MAVLRWLGYGLAAVIGLFVALIALIQTPPGKAALVSVIEWAGSSDSARIEITGLRGWVPFGLGIDQVALSDPEGDWLRLEEVSVDGRALALFTGHVALDRVNVRTVQLLRQPRAEGGSSDGGGGIALPFEVRHLTVDQIIIAEPVFGTPALLSADGDIDAWVSAPGVNLRLDVARIDDLGEGQIALNMRLDPDPWRIDAWFEMAETRDGLLQAALELPDRAPYALSARVSGGLEDLTADLNGRFAGGEILTGTARIRDQNGARRVGAALTGDLSNVLPPALRPYLGGDIRLDFDAALTPGAGIDIAEARLAAAGLTADANGGLSLGQGRDNLHVEIALDPQLDTGVTDAPLVRGTAVVRAQGGDPDAEIAARIDAASIDMDGLVLADSSALVVATGDAPTALGSTRFAFKVDGDLGSGSVGAISLADWLGVGARFAAMGVFDRNAGLAINTASLTGAGIRAAFDGDLTPDRADGALDIVLADGPRPPVGPILAGGGKLTADTEFDLVRLTGFLDLDGVFTGLDVEDVPAAGLLDGDVTISGRVTAAEDGEVRFDRTTFETASALLVIDGVADPDRLDIEISGGTDQLAAIDPQLAGSVSFDGRLSGTADAPRLVAEASGRDVMLSGHPLDDPRIDVDGELGPFGPSGRVAATATLDRQPVELAFTVVSDQAAMRFNEIRAQVANALAEGALVWPSSGAPTGAIDISAPDLSVIGPLVLTELSGTLDGNLEFREIGGQPGVTFVARAREIAADDMRLASADINGRITDLLGEMLIDANARMATLVVGETTVRSLTGQARSQGGATRFSLEADLIDATVATAGALTATADSIDVTLDSARIAARGIEGRLTQQARIRQTGGVTEIEGARFAVGSGSIDVGGRVADTLAITVNVAALPIEIIGPFAPGLDPRGTVSATAEVGGTTDAPRVDWTLDWRNASIAETRAFGAPAMTVAGRGVYRDVVVELAGITASGGGLELTAQGQVPLTPGGRMNVSVDGGLPLAFVRPLLQDTGVAVDGPAAFDLAVTGSTASPVVNGVATISGAVVVLRDAGVRLTGLDARMQLEPNVVRIESLNADIDGGGQVSATGTVGYGGQAPVLDLAINASNARFAYQDIVTAQFGADLTARGTVQQDLLIAGQVDVARADVRVPDGLPTSIGQFGVRHENAPEAVVAQQPQSAAPQTQRTGVSMGRLDVQVNAPREIYVRGRGLDSELGGSVRLRGPIEAPSADGAFSMRRGHFDFLGQRLTFSRGTLTFEGGFDPRLDFFASTVAQGSTVGIEIGGRASLPTFNVTSQPPLPTEEALALLLFGRQFDQLSAVEIAQLAEGVAVLGGAPGVTSRLNNLARQLGLDRLGVTTGEDGSPALSIGRQLTDRLNLGVEQGTNAGDTRLQLDLDILNNFRARGQVAPDGEGKVGVGVERDY